MDTALELAPRNAALWLSAGDCYLEAFRRSVKGRPQAAPAGETPPLAAQALRAYRRAIELYPNNALYHARLAVAFRAVGDEAGFGREAAAALTLDAQTPHADKKLPPDVRRQLAEPVAHSQGMR
jgi:tetratricopeptide (TPR) repeat protein